MFNMLMIIGWSFNFYAEVADYITGHDTRNYNPECYAHVLSPRCE